jgi:hypothetical protein
MRAAIAPSDWPQRCAPSPESLMTSTMASGIAVRAARYQLSSQLSTSLCRYCRAMTTVTRPRHVPILERLENAGEKASQWVPAPIRKVAYAVTAPLYMGASFGAVGATVGGVLGGLGGPLGLVVVGATGFAMGASIGATLGAQLGLAALTGKDR